jgi:DNA-binding NtrC family response regulator
MHHNSSDLLELAARVAQLSEERWGIRGRTVIVGRDPSLAEAQHKLLQFAQADAPVLITGETGSGKEMFARALHVLSARSKLPFLSVNCAKFQDSQLLATELFGHCRGSFTGASTDRPGVFEEAGSGIVFLDEVAELSLAAQSMLLRALSEGEVVRVGENRPRHVQARVVAATACDLATAVKSGVFRQDLYFRLRFLRLRIPPLRERGDDWSLMTLHYLSQLNRQFTTNKTFDDDSLAMLAGYRWPGNVRELRGLIEIAYHSCRGECITPGDFADELMDGHTPATSHVEEPAPVTPHANGHGHGAHDLLGLLVASKKNFWDGVYGPYKARELNRSEVKELIGLGLQVTRGSYKRLLPLFGIAPKDYLKFMDFLRHHQLKPNAPSEPNEALLKALNPEPL